MFHNKNPKSFVFNFWGSLQSRGVYYSYFLSTIYYFLSPISYRPQAVLFLPKRRSDIFPSLPYSLVESLIRLLAFQTA